MPSTTTSTMAFTTLLNFLQSLFTDCDLSLCFIPAAFVIEILPHIYAITVYNRSAFRKQTLPGSGELIRLARINLIRQSDTLDRVLRAESVYTTGRLQTVFFVAAVVAGSSLRIERLHLNVMSLAYLVSRLISIDCGIFGKGFPATVTRHCVDTASYCLVGLIYVVISNILQGLVS